MLFPKPEKRGPKAPKPLRRLARLRPMSKRKRAQMPLRKTTRQQVIERDRGRCRCCADPCGEAGHVHEIVFRSRGGSPVELANCVLLCARCHARVHAHEIWIVCLDPLEGANGAIEFTTEAPTGDLDDGEEDGG